MVLLDNDIYKETKEIVWGKRRPSPLVIELSEWFRIRYSVKVLNIQFSKLPGPQENRFRLYVIVENTEDYQKMHVSRFRHNPEYQAQIALEFRKLAVKYRFTDEMSLENLYVTYNDFSDEARTEANWGAAQEVAAQIKRRYPVVWDVISVFSSSVVFYYADTDIGVNENNGISKAIRDTYYSILKKYDEFNYFTEENISLKFDSKENLDKNYQGNLFYYTR